LSALGKLLHFHASGSRLGGMRMISVLSLSAVKIIQTSGKAYITMPSSSSA